MPLVRYEIRNEYSLANSELYRSAGKDDPAALLEGVAMAGLVGIVRQLGDLAEFAAEIFHDLHEEVMATAARGHGLMIRVQQLEAEFPSVEKALMSEKNQLRFAYAIGADWHASIRYDQNHLTQGDLPRFILNSYEECRGPPRLFLLDKFDGAGAGACLKRYTDPSFFKIKWAGTELMKAEEARRQKKARRVKKKGQRQRNGETTDFTPVHGRVRYSSLNLERPKHFRGNLVNTSKQKLKSKEVYETPLPDQRIEREHLKGPLNISSPMEEHVPGFSCMFDNNLNSKHFNSSSVQDQVINRHYAEGPNEKFIFGEDASESFSHESEEKPAVKIVQRVKLNDNITTISSSETQSSRIIAEVDADRIYQNFIHAEQNDVLVNSEIKQEANVNEDENDDVASETDNYVDALATMELEIETDSESKTKHEVDPDFNSKHKETGRELLERHAYCLEFSDAEATAFYNCDSSDESSKIETSSGFLNNNPAYVSSNLESTSCTVTSTSECDSANVDLKNNLDSASLSLGISKDLFFASNDGSLMSSEVLKNVHLSLDEKMQNDTDVSVKEEKLNGIDMPTPVADAISHAVTANVEMNNFVNKEFSSAFQNNDSRDAFANASCLDGVDYGEESFRFSTSGSSLLLGTGEPQTSPYKEPVAVSESFEGIMEDDYLQISSLNVHEGEDLGYPAISNNYIDESAATSELAAGKENSVMHASHEFIGSQTDDAENELPEPREYEAYDSHLVQLLRGSGCSSPVSPGQIFIESDINIKHSGPAAESMPQHSIYAEFIGPGIDSEVRDDQSCTDRCLGHVPTLKSIAGSQEIDLEVSECTESTLKSIAGSQEIDLEVSKCTESILDPRTIDLPPQLNAREGIQDSHFNSSKTSPTEDSECSSPVSVGQPSVESDVDIEHSESAAESMPQDSVHAESIVTGMDSEVRDDQSCAGRYVGHVPALKSKMDGGENGESPENTYATEAMKSKMGLQEDDQEVPECAESVLDVRPIDLPPQLNLPEGFQNDHVNSSKASPTEALNACSGDNFTSISDGSNFIEKNISNDIPTKEVKIYSEEAMDIDAAAVKIPINSSILDNTCRKELSTEFASAETSINDRVLPDVSSHSKSTETWNDGGSFEKNVDIESHSDSHFEPPTELFNSWTSANSFSENVYMDSLHAEQNMQILHVIPPVKPNASPHSGSVEPCSDGGLFENNVKSESHANVHLGAPPEVFSSSPSANLFSKTVEADSPSAKSDMLLLHVIPPVKPVGAEPVLHVIPAVKPVGAEPVLHVIPPVKPVGAEPVLHVIPPVKPGGAEEQARSPSNFNNKEDLEDEPPSPPLEHIKISFPPPDSPLSMYSTSSDHVSESPSPGKHKHSQSKADELSSSFHLLPEPAIPLQQADENPNMRIMGSLSLHRQRKSSETFSDKLHISQIKDTDDDSEDEGLKEFGKSSPEISPAFYNQSLGPTEGLAVFSGRNAVSDADTGSPGVLSTTSMTISSSPDTARNSLLNFKCSSADAASSSSHSRNISLGSSPRSTMFSAPHSPISFEETCHEIQDLSMSDSPALESGALVLSSSTLEDNIECNWHEMPPSPQETCERNQELFRSKSPVLESGALVPSSSTLQSNSESTFNEMPPPPPLPPLEWRMMKPQKISSLPLLEGVKPPTPPAFPPIMTNSLMQDPSSSSVPAIQKMPVDRRDSLIEEIASHDKTTLKKVPKQVAPISAKPVDEREVLLKQIRTKSFNLRPTSVVKHNIPRPTTNINVAAILEKANAIRQAFAGSDEDDDEGGVWSDA